MFAKNQNAPDAEQLYNRNRSWLLVATALTAVNIVLYLIGSDTYFLASATVPYMLAIYGDAFAMELGAVQIKIIALVAAAVILGLYLLCWGMSKKSYKWLTGALVMFILDFAVLLYLSFADGFDVSMIMDLLFHVIILATLIAGVRNGKKLKAEREADVAELQRSAEATGDMQESVNTVIEE